MATTSVTAEQGGTYTPRVKDFMTLDEAHERNVKKDMYRIRVVLKNLKGVNRVMYIDRPSLLWRKGWVISFEGPEWRRIGFAGIYKCVDFSAGSYDENLGDLKQTSARYLLEQFMGIPVNHSAIKNRGISIGPIVFFSVLGWMIYKWITLT